MCGGSHSMPRRSGPTISERSKRYRESFLRRREGARMRRIETNSRMSKHRGDGHETLVGDCSRSWSARRTGRSCYSMRGTIACPSRCTEPSTTDSTSSAPLAWRRGSWHGHLRDNVGSCARNWSHTFCRPREVVWQSRPRAPRDGWWAARHRSDGG